MEAMWYSQTDFRLFGKCRMWCVSKDLVEKILCWILLLFVWRLCSSCGVLLTFRSWMITRAGGGRRRIFSFICLYLLDIWLRSLYVFELDLPKPWQVFLRNEGPCTLCCVNNLHSGYTISWLSACLKLGNTWDDNFRYGLNIKTLTYAFY